MDQGLQLNFSSIKRMGVLCFNSW